MFCHVGALRIPAGFLQEQIDIYLPRNGFVGIRWWRGFGVMRLDLTDLLEFFFFLPQEFLHFLELFFQFGDAFLEFYEGRIPGDDAGVEGFDIDAFVAVHPHHPCSEAVHDVKGVKGFFGLRAAAGMHGIIAKFANEVHLFEQGGCEQVAEILLMDQCIEAGIVGQFKICVVFVQPPNPFLEAFSAEHGGVWRGGEGVLLRFH